MINWRSSLKRFTFCLILTVVLMLSGFGTPGTLAQNSPSVYTDVARQRLMIHVIAHYLHTISQGQIDIDSAVLIPCRVYRFSPLLPYNEGYSDGKATLGQNYLDQQKTSQAISLLNTLKGTPRLQLLLDLGNFFTFRPGTAPTDLLQANKYVSELLKLTQHEDTKWRIEALILSANLRHQSRQDADAIKLLDEIFQLCKAPRQQITLGRAFMLKADLYPYGSPQRLYCLQKALTLFSANKNNEKMIEALSQINVEHFVLKKFDVAEQLMKRIYNLQDSIKFQQQQYVCDGLAFLATRKGNLSTAMTYSNKSLANLRSKNDSVFKSIFYIRRAIIYERLKKPKEILVWFNKALEDKSPGTRLYWYKAMIGKIGVLNGLERINEARDLQLEAAKQYPPNTIFEKMHFAMESGKTFESLGDFQAAKKYYRAFLDIARNFPPEYIYDEYPAAFFKIAAFHRLIGETVESRKLLEEGHHYASKSDMERSGIYYYNLFKLDSTERKYLSAISNLQLSNKFTDSAFSHDQRKRTEELLVQYETEKKDRDIKYLNSQNQLERIRSREADRTKNISLAGFVLVIIFLGLLYNSYLNKKKINSILESNQKQLDQKNLSLEKLNNEQDFLLKEKEWLIKEVHHRVKNNLQMVTTLLYSQSVFLKDNNAKLAIKDSLRRMHAMSLIHQKLYQEENTSSIDMQEYITELTTYIQESFDSGRTITFENDIENIELEIAQAIPLGLILTESVVNAIKYAFFNNDKGTVSISLKKDDDQTLVLRISDNGRGLPAEIATLGGQSLGLNLMKGLAKQLKGTFKIEDKHGVHITLRFGIVRQA